MLKFTHYFLSILLIAGALSCKNTSNKKDKKSTCTSKFEKTEFGTLPDGRKAYLFTLKNDNGLVAKITNYGGIVTSLMVSDKNGKFEDIVLGYDNLDDYLNNEVQFFGALIGRYGNRIDKGKFEIDGNEYNLVVNSGNHHLHGGFKGFYAVLWEAEEDSSDEGPSLKLTYLSKDGEEGYPGNLSVTAIYTLTNENGLKVEFWAETDTPTIVNLTQHSYFNLTAMKESILEHELTIKADSFTPVNPELIPTGEILPVEGIPLDFRTPKTIGQDVEQYENGYDHNFVLNNKSGEFEEIAVVKEPKSGRILRIFSTEPGLQFYSGGFLNGSLIGKDNIAYKRFYGFCVEPQHYPDSPNHPNFPSTILRPGEKYHHLMEYRFEIE